MRSLLTFVLVCILTSAAFPQAPCAPAKHAKLPGISELTYHRARRMLLKAGWQPFQTIPFNRADEYRQTTVGNGEIFWKRGYTELKDCAGTGLAPCTFLFADAYGNRLEVVTLGEELEEKPRSYATVSSYRFVCKTEEETDQAPR